MAVCDPTRVLLDLPWLSSDVRAIARLRQLTPLPGADVQIHGQMTVPLTSFQLANIRVRCVLRESSNGLPLDRRSFVIALGAGMFLATFRARAQRSALPVIGYLGAESPAAFASRLRAFRQGLAEAGYVEGRNVAIEFRWAEGQHSRLTALAAELVSRRVDVIVAPGGAPAALAAKAATTSIPIVFEMGGDPIALGLVESLSRPGGNLTGVASFNVDLSPKRLQFLSEVIPTTRPVAVLVNPTSPTTESQINRLEAAARELKVQIHIVRAANRAGVRGGFRQDARTECGGPGRGIRYLFRPA